MLLGLLLAFPVSIVAKVDKTHGVSPSLLAHYTPTNEGSTSVWTCLDGSKTISWSSVNDDYCDCPDGSDEPGTSACPNSTFYCRNEGHLAAFIPSSRVGDGLCEPECCDGSDERPDLCNNICKEVGELYRQEQVVKTKVRKTGAKIRSSYITFAEKEKKRLEGEISKSASEMSIREKEVARLKDLLERTESLSAAELEHKKQSPLYASLITHSQALKSLQREYKAQVEKANALGDILDALRTGYNPNYQDMAVLEAVRGWETIAGLPHINDVAKGEESNEEEEGSDSSAEEEDVLEEGMWSASRLEFELDSLLGTNYDSLLLAHDQHVDAPAPVESFLFDVAAYIPEALLPQYEALRDGLKSVLALLGVGPKDSTDSSAETTRARDVLREAEKKLNDIKREKEKAEEELSRLSDPTWYGPQGEWKKLAGTCLEKDTGEYTYELCFFGEARQKPNKGGANQNLGKFESWNSAPGVEVGSSEYYTKQHYTRGTKCWNGPSRSVTFVMSCGTENAILSVAEPEKCEYEFTGTSPALCLPLDSTPEGKREEL